MKTGYTLIAAFLLVPALSFGQTFTRSTSILTNQTARSGGCVGIADMDGDGLDDLILLHLSTDLYVDYQNPDGSFTTEYYGKMSSTKQWGMAVGDVNGDGHKDFFCGDNASRIYYKEINGRGQAGGWTTLHSSSGFFMQCGNMADIDNDGSLDIFACNDIGQPFVYMNDGEGGLSREFPIDFTSTPASDMSGNYGSVWIDVDNDGDLDLFIAKCRQGVNNPDDPRRWNRLFINDGNGNYTEETTAHGLENHNQSWSADFGDIDNDGDLDLVVTNHNRSLQLYLNDGTGHFTEATTGSGIEYSGSFLQVKLVDFDNDGFLDLITAGNLAGNGEYYFHGNGDGTFTRIMDMLPEPSPRVLHSFAVGDMNHDGFIDVYASYGSGYVTPSSNRYDQLYLNDGNANHFLAFNLRGKESNPDGVGARVTLYGDWGTQIREVRAGESYGIVCSFTCNFGLGAATMADSAIVRWPSGKVDKYYGLAADQWVTMNEGETRNGMVAAKVFLDGPFVPATGLMKDDLRVQGFIPMSEPYTAMDFTSTFDGLEQRVVPGVYSVTGNNAIVDWVWVELRADADPSQVVAAKAALLQRDGDVVDLDGKSPIGMGVPDGDYHLVIRHRNHLGVMTASSHALDGAPTSIDLTTTSTGLWGTDAARANGSYQTLWSGEVNGDGQVKFTGMGNDRDALLLTLGGGAPTASWEGYANADVNMDGSIKFTGMANDRDPILVNVGSNPPTRVLVEQLP